MSIKLILFDIDGTLVYGRNEAHVNAYSFALKIVFGIDAKIKENETKGKTDPMIFRELAKREGVEEENVEVQLKEIFRIAVEYVKEHIVDSDLNVIPGVKELLEELKNRNYHLGLVSGNLEEIAKLKLKKVGLFKYFEFGGFGEISENRSQILENAIKQASEKFDSSIEKENVIYVGDTPKDVEAGKKIGVKTFVIENKVFPKEELMKYNPDYIFKDFLDVNEFINIVSKFN